jgi:transcriptional regulator with XRE-family HTH domain
MAQSTKKTSNEFELGVRNFAAWQDLMDQLVAAREKQGLSQKEMGERMGISQSAVAQFELSSANPTISSIVRYANELGIELVLKTK